jgi:hypothetical protein
MNGIDFIALMEPVARKLLGEPNKALSKPGRELRWGTHGSLSVDLVKGTFYDHENTSGGGVLALIKLKTGCASDGEAIAWLQREVLITGDARMASVTGFGISMACGAFYIGYQKLSRQSRMITPSS